MKRRSIRTRNKNQIQTKKENETKKRACYSDLSDDVIELVGSFLFTTENARQNQAALAVWCRVDKVSSCIPQSKFLVFLYYDHS